MMEIDQVGEKAVSSDNGRALTMAGMMDGRWEPLMADPTAWSVADEKVAPWDI